MAAHLISQNGSRNLFSGGAFGKLPRELTKPAEGLAAWFARAEANAAGLRRRLDDLGGERQDPLRLSPCGRRRKPGWSAGNGLGRHPPPCPPREKPLHGPYIGVAGAGTDGSTRL